ncbi:glycosyltransferase family 4 protein [Roseospirillum parvum]|uniref:Glycosyltransferase involved in cell wall bisynthesis n=1 Tax=Roseospirillum parvum TaxID=83401 RepID=A0A1G7WXA8_9PROT|nr:glycosyltransferase family 4 protein [Roseospirillum parvum]SDG76561.1 Glycosyltransferase involved in cell wall bisynthesis [Roseospirillum parvum]
MSDGGNRLQPAPAPPDGGRPLKVLCLDIEGGHGGSSRSLLASLSRIDRERVEPLVWCRRPGSVVEKYQELGIPCRVTPEMPKISALERNSRTLLDLARLATQLFRARGFLRRLVDTARTADVVHLNHEGLWLLAYWLKARTRVAVTLHRRTMLPNTVFGHLQVNLIHRAVDGQVFISDNERRNAEDLGRHPPIGPVLFNIAEPPAPGTAPHPACRDDPRFKVALLANFAWIRGTDRLLEVAQALAARGAQDRVVFLVAGTMRMPRRYPGPLAQAARQGWQFDQVVERSQIAGMIRFLGHISDPERVLVGCDALLRLSRGNNPWGRDVLEALAAGRPVLTVGSYQRFVEHDVTGVLLPRFDAGQMADHILALAEDPARTRRLGAAGAERIARLCDGPTQAAALAEVWRAAAARKAGLRADRTG